MTSRKTQLGFIAWNVASTAVVLMLLAACPSVTWVVLASST